MSIRTLGLTLGIFWGVAMFFLAWWMMFTGHAEGPITLLERMYIGYSFTPTGSVIGAVWGFVDGGIVGIVFAWLYNLIDRKD